MAKKPPTKAEKEHISRVAEIGCIACMNMGYPNTPAEIHHIRAGAGAGQRSSHFRVIPLCFHHHSAQGSDGFHKAPRGWQERHGTEEELLAQVTGMLEGI